MPENYLTKITEIKEQLTDIRSTLDEIVENISSLADGGFKAESAAYYIGEAIDLLDKVDVHGQQY